MKDNDLNKILYTDFISTETLIANLLEQKEFKKAVTRSNLCKFWNKIAGDKFTDKSKPYSLAGTTMIIACKNAIVAQELNLRKSQLLNAIEPYLKSLKLNVKDLKFDAKKWN